MKFSYIIDKSFIGKFIDKKVQIWDELNPEKIYVENIRKFFNLNTRFAKFLCEIATNQGIFIKKYEVQCPNEKRAIAEYKSKSEIPEFIECMNCQLFEREYRFPIKNCDVVEFYQLANSAL